MNWRRQKRQILLFLGPILVPAVVLVGQAVRVFRQDREIAEKKIVEQRRDDFERLRRQLADRLETIKLQEINRRMRAPDSQANGSSQDSQIVLVTPLKDGRMAMPWRTESAPADLPPGFASYVRAGQSAEFVSKDVSSASERYQQAIALASAPLEDCDARLQLGRVLVKAKRMNEAQVTFGSILQRCGTMADEDGIPYRMYAVQSLLKAGLASDPERRFVLDEVDKASQVAWYPPLQLYFLRSLLESLNGPELTQVSNSLSAQINKVEQTVALDADMSRIRIRLESSSPDKTKQSQTTWLAYGPEPWLVTITPASPPVPSLVFEVSSRSVSPRDVRLITSATPGSESLGEFFPGLWVKWPQDRDKPIGTSLPPSLYIAGLALVLSITILGGYLLLRDIDRDLRLAEMRSHFVASVSHELKTPLTVIRMYAEMLFLGQTPDNKTTAEYHQTIMNESERLSQLVDNVLDFSKIERDSRNYVMRPTLLADVVQSVVRTIQPPLDKERFELTVRVDETLPSISADPLALEQAILNLLTNAMKYSGNSRKIELQVKRAGGEAAIEVRDWGIGIAPEDQAHVFEKFYRVRSAATESISGTGLGLTLVAHIVQAHGGRVAVDSAPGKGSTFAIRIPLRASEVPA